MKSILYIGAVLMTGACIYGFVDYKKASNSKEFKSLYRSEPASTKAALSPKEESAVKSIQKVNEFVPVPVTKLVNSEDQELTNEFNKVKSADSKRKATKRKKLNYKLYSRSSLEKYIPPVIEEDKAVEKTEKK